MGYLRNIRKKTGWEVEYQFNIRKKTVRRWNIHLISGKYGFKIIEYTENSVEVVCPCSDTLLKVRTICPKFGHPVQSLDTLPKV